MDWQRFGWFLTVIGVLGGLVGLLVADGKKSDDRVTQIATGVAGSSASGWTTLAIVGGVVAVIGIGMVVSSIDWSSGGGDDSPGGA